MKNISILGSTGSIGRNTMEVVSRFPDRFRVVGLAAKNNIELLERQVHACRPQAVAVFDETAAEELKKKDLPAEILTGEKGLCAIAELEDADMVVSAIVGSACLVPTLTAVRADKHIALATKETLVMAGSLIMAEALKRQVMVLPVDSEHSAVFQCLDGRNRDEVKRIILTASGGPFIDADVSELEDVTPEKALKHPNWEMGKKVTIDSATLMNKGLEVIEAHWLFGMPAEKIKVLLHPQSIVHSMVEFVDGSVIAQLSVPDMKGPIGYALSYPERFDNIMEPLDLSKTGELTFREPDMTRYPSLSLTYEALRTGKTMPCVLNAANESAVEAFLEGRIGFTRIPEVVSGTMKQHSVSDGTTIEDFINVSNWAALKAEEIIGSFSG